MIQREQRGDAADFRLGNVIFFLFRRKRLDEVFPNRGSREGGRYR